MLTSYGQQNYAYTGEGKTIHIRIKDIKKNLDIQNIISITWSQDDSKCICCSEKNVYIYDTTDYTNKTIINADGDEKILKVAAHPTKNEYVCISTKKIIHFNDSNKTLDGANTNIDEISDMDWSYDGEYIAYCNDQGIYVYNYNDNVKSEIRTLKYKKTTHVNYKATYTDASYTGIYQVAFVGNDNCCLYAIYREYGESRCLKLNGIHDKEKKYPFEYPDIRYFKYQDRSGVHTGGRQVGYNIKQLIRKSLLFGTFYITVSNYTECRIYLGDFMPVKSVTLPVNRFRDSPKDTYDIQLNKFQGLSGTHKDLSVSQDGSQIIYFNGNNDICKISIQNILSTIDDYKSFEEAKNIFYTGKELNTETLTKLVELRNTYYTTVKENDLIKELIGIDEDDDWYKKKTYGKFIKDINIETFYKWCTSLKDVKKNDETLTKLVELKNEYKEEWYALGKNAINHMLDKIGQKKKDGVNGYELLIKNKKIDIKELFDLYSVRIEMNKDFETKTYGELVKFYNVGEKNYKANWEKNKTKEKAYKWYRKQLLTKIKKNKNVEKKTMGEVKKNIKRYTNEQLEALANNLYSNIVLKF